MTKVVESKRSKALDLRVDFFFECLNFVFQSRRKLFCGVNGLRDLVNFKTVVGVRRTMPEAPGLLRGLNKRGSQYR